MNSKEVSEKKRELLSVAKWAAKEAGVRVVFDGSNGKSDVDERIIHMPKAIPIDRAALATTTIIHEAMHMKHTPKYLGRVPRSRLDGIIMNALEDERIEFLACKQLPALDVLLENSVRILRKDVATGAEGTKIPNGAKLLINHASKNSGTRIFDVNMTYADFSKVNQALNNAAKLHTSIATIRTKAAFKKQIHNYYKMLDDLKVLLELKDEDFPEEKNEKECKAEGSSNGEDMLKELIEGMRAPSNGIEGIDMTGAEELYSPLELTQMARQRIKDALKISVMREVDDGTELKTENISSFFCGDVEDLFTEKVKEKQVRTKVYFLLDSSGSMEQSDLISNIDDVLGSYDNKNHKGMKHNSRFRVASAVLGALREIVDDVACETNGSIAYDTYVFSGNTIKVSGDKLPFIGGGTCLYGSMEEVFKDIKKDMPYDKRIFLVITDGDVGNYQQIRALVDKEAQDIRVVFVGIGGDDSELVHKHVKNLSSAEETIIEALEQAL